MSPSAPNPKPRRRDGPTEPGEARRDAEGDSRALGPDDGASEKRWWYTSRPCGFRHESNVGEGKNSRLGQAMEQAGGIKPET